MSNKGTGAASGAAAGAATGAAVGSIVPVVGTAVGAVVGAVIGGIAGLFSGSAADEKIRAAKQQQRLLEAYLGSMKGYAGTTKKLQLANAGIMLKRGIRDIEKFTKISESYAKAWSSQAGVYQTTVLPNLITGVGRQGSERLLDARERYAIMQNQVQQEYFQNLAAIQTKYTGGSMDVIQSKANAQAAFYEQQSEMWQRAGQIMAMSAMSAPAAGGSSAATSSGSSYGYSSMGNTGNSMVSSNAIGYYGNTGQTAAASSGSSYAANPIAVKFGKSALSAYSMMK